jgi:hypothetical protein
MTTTQPAPASPDRRDGTSISKYQDVEVGHWYRATLGGAYTVITEPVEVVDLEWSQAAGDAIVYVRKYRDTKVHCTPFAAWRAGMRPTLPPWAE